MTFIVDCPPGYFCAGPTMKIVIPAGSIIFTPTDFGPNPPAWGQPWGLQPGVVQISCGGRTLNLVLEPARQAYGNLLDSQGKEVPTDVLFSPDQIVAMMLFWAECQAKKQAIQQLNPQLPTHAALNISFSEIV
jgi:hypothetical protein